MVISNDDGVDAPGLEILASAFRGRCELLIVAPITERSATSHAVNMEAEWYIEQRGPERYAVDGSPADCVYLALCQLAPRRPSLVLSGINRGYNLGTDVFYSGTVAAAAEAVILGVPALAISAQAQSTPETLRRAARFASALAAWVLGNGWGPGDTLLNVNVPAGDFEAFSVGSLGTRRYPPPPRLPGPLAPRGRLRLDRPRISGLEGSVGQDADIVRSGLISITPLRLDWTHPGEVQTLSRVLRLDGFEHRERAGGEPEGQSR
ncbi:MAG: 5'/3'-nucleotidase SurE [Polyangia bacterium]|nr:5'/3'-nucleotidase SurE [Polyangia bacterium]